MRGVQKAINDFDMSWVKSREGGRKYRELQKARTQDLSDMRTAARRPAADQPEPLQPRGGVHHVEARA